MKPSLGRIVIARTSQAFNGSNEHPAIINRVWGSNDPAEAKGAHVAVNIAVLPDCGASFTATSVALFETKEEADASGFSSCCWWPPRV